MAEDDGIEPMNHVLTKADGDRMNSCDDLPALHLSMSQMCAGTVLESWHLEAKGKTMKEAQEAVEFLFGMRQRALESYDKRRQPK